MKHRKKKSTTAPPHIFLTAITHNVVVVLQCRKRFDVTLRYPDTAEWLEVKCDIVY